MNKLLIHNIIRLTALLVPVVFSELVYVFNDFNRGAVFPYALLIETIFIFIPLTVVLLVLIYTILKKFLKEELREMILTIFVLFASYILCMIVYMNAKDVSSYN